MRTPTATTTSTFFMLVTISSRTSLNVPSTRTFGWFPAQQDLFLITEPFHSKTHPRADLPAPTNAIMRAGIPYGGEGTYSISSFVWSAHVCATLFLILVTSSELSTKKSTIPRGLAFVSYQSQIAQGFRFQQVQWANNPAFAPNKATQPGKCGGRCAEASFVNLC